MEPRGARTYRGGPSEASAAFTVFFDTPNSRAMALMGTCSERCSLRISAQSSTLSTLFLPGPWTVPGLREGVSFHASPTGEVLWLDFGLDPSEDIAASLGRAAHVEAGHSTYLPHKQRSQGD